MSERKVINKYIPPNFDPEKIARGGGRRPYTVRLMAPFSMRCNTCKEYIYKGRKFNARKETVYTEMYLTIKIFRFYIRCPTCAAEITFKTDPKNADYVAEHGATRNFEPWRDEAKEEEEGKARRLLEEMHNPMRALENKTYDSKREIDIMEGLDEIRTVNARLEAVDAGSLFQSFSAEEAQLGDPKSPDQDEDENLTKAAFNQIRRIDDAELETPAEFPAARPADKPPVDPAQKRRAAAAALGIVPKKRSPLLNCK